MNERDKFGKLIVRRNANQRSYYQRHRERLAARRRERYATDPDFRARKLAIDRRYHEKSKDKHRLYQLSHRYGLTAEAYQRLVDAQGGVCAICARVPQGRGKKSGTFHVDHCHDSDVVRGLLCDSCNRAIGLLGDSAAVLFKAAMYLVAHETKRVPA